MTQGYPVGVQAWYNNFVEVDPGDPGHVYVGLEEVYETEDGGATWKTIGPYWNFGFDCFDPSDPVGGCPPTTHPDQHSIAIYGGKVYIGNDGGVYTRPLRPRPAPRTRPGTPPTGATTTPACAPCSTTRWAPAGTRTVAATPVAGGLQDNGGSLLRAGAASRSARSAATAATSSSTPATAARSSTSTSSWRCG